MITKGTLEAINNGILTDSQLNEAIHHYSELEKNLKCHGERYHLVWEDVFFTLMILEDYREKRKK